MTAEATDDWVPTKVQFKETDAWNMHMVLAEAIADGVEFFAARDHGFPGYLEVAEWEAVLAEIVEGFRAVRHLGDNPTLTPEGEAKLERAWDLFRLNFMGLWT